MKTVFQGVLRGKAMVWEGHLRLKILDMLWLYRGVQVRVLLVHFCNFSGITSKESSCLWYHMYMEFWMCLWKYYEADLFPDDNKCILFGLPHLCTSWLLCTWVFLNPKYYQYVYCIKQRPTLKHSPCCKVFISWRRQPMLHSLVIYKKI